MMLAARMKYLDLGIPYPYIGGIPGIFWGNFWLCVIMGISGSLMLFVICEWMGNCKWLEYLGRHTITIYLLQEAVMAFIIRQYENLNFNISLIVSVPVFVLSTAFICAFMDQLFNKYARFLKGKF